MPGNLRPAKLLLWVVIAVAVLATWAPYFGAFERLVWVGPLPFGLAWVLTWNAVLTGCAIAMYFVHFRPLYERLLADPLPEPEVDVR